MKFTAERVDQLEVKFTFQFIEKLNANVLITRNLCQKFKFVSEIAALF